MGQAGAAEEHFATATAIEPRWRNMEFVHVQTRWPPKLYAAMQKFLSISPSWCRRVCVKLWLLCCFVIGVHCFLVFSSTSCAWLSRTYVMLIAEDSSCNGMARSHDILQPEAILKTYIWHYLGAFGNSNMQSIPSLLKQCRVQTG